jgi:hypothetical protein
MSSDFVDVRWGPDADADELDGLEGKKGKDTALDRTGLDGLLLTSSRLAPHEVYVMK